MHALRHVHGVLVPGGTLVDLHPVVEEQLETSAGAVIGVIPEPAFVSTDLPNAEARLRDAIRDGLFAFETRVEFDVLQHFDRVKDLLEAKKPKLDGEAALLSRIRAAPFPLLAREHVVLQRLRAL